MNTLEILDTHTLEDGRRLVVVHDIDAEEPDRAEVEQHQRWRDGRVFGVLLQRPVTYHEVNGPRVRIEWETEDSLWGCYLDKDYTLLDVAESYFWL